MEVKKNCERTGTLSAHHLSLSRVQVLLSYTKSVINTRLLIFLLIVPSRHRYKYFMAKKLM